MPKLFFPYGKKIQNIQDENEISKNLDLLVIIIKKIPSALENDKAHPFAKVYKDLWPLLSNLLEKYQNNEDMVE